MAEEDIDSARRGSSAKDTQLILAEFESTMRDPRAAFPPLHLGHLIISFIQLVFRVLPLLPGLRMGALKMNQGAPHQHIGRIPSCSR